jgi:hypothetical protein
MVSFVDSNRARKKSTLKCSEDFSLSIFFSFPAADRLFFFPSLSLSLIERREKERIKYMKKINK